MKKITKTVKKLIKDQSGSGAIEYLIVIAAVGVIATAIFASLQGKLAGDNGDSAVDQINEGIGDMINEWQWKDPTNNPIGGN